MIKKTKLAIIGSGPAGLTAGIYAGRAQLAPVLFAGLKAGGQLMYTSVVENFPGFVQGINGADLMINMRAQAERFNTQIIDQWVTAVDLARRPFKIWTYLPAGFDAQDFESLSGEAWSKFQSQVRLVPHYLEAETLLIATGAAAITPNIQGEKEFFGKGIATCAVCDAAFFKDKRTFVVGGGDSAMEDALALANFAQTVTLIHRRDQFKASQIMQQRVFNHSKIKVLWHTQVLAAEGKTRLESITVADVAGKNPKTLPADGLFFAIGHRPLTQLFAGQIELDAHGYVVTGSSLTAQGLTMAQSRQLPNGLIDFPTMTSVAGVFAAGDVVDVRFKQAITSAGQGTAASLDIEKFLAVH